MSGSDDTERDLRLELMRLDRKLKVRDLKLKDQQLAFEPIKMVFLAGGFAGALVAVLRVFMH
ncbi:hypothetical protein [Phenylobacterium sp.]|uniref:hypothetical protein n=1 Tax=Phenylobacterium sp. TaxID=1871053 RepID=UPI0025E06F71|nr:hypothetical protein [Phenylobacterium sp.]MBX3482120.1 hypothetical protein [Phenylobacterium sp.]